MLQRILNIIKAYSLKAIVDGFSVSSFLFALALAFGANSKIGIYPSLISAAMSLFLTGTFSKRLVFAPSCAVFLLFNHVILNYGENVAFSASLVAGILVFISAFLKLDRLFKYTSPAAVQGLYLGFFIVMALFQTTEYFDIGAKGNTAVQMLQSYKGVGFHANWRTVLFATIMLVIMITYPIKFKKFHKYLSAAFFGAVLNSALNILLNPVRSYTNVPELGSINLDGFKDAFNPSLSFSTSYISEVFLCGTAIAFIILIELSASTLVSETRRLPSYSLGALNVLSSFAGMPVSVSSRLSRKNPFAGIFGLCFFTAFLFLYNIFFSRLPVSVLGTMLVITAWSSIKWKQVTAVFRSKSALHILIFILIAACTVLTNLPAAVIISAIAGILLGLNRPPIHFRKPL